MNILILLFSFLTVLALSAASFWQTYSTICMEQKSICGNLAANRKAENLIQKRAFRKLPSLTPQTTAEGGSSTKKNSSTFHSHRLSCPPHEQARMAIAGLWKEESRSYVEGVFHRLLKELYGHTAWFKKANERGEVDALMTSIIRHGKGVEGPFPLHDLFSSLPRNQAELLYKMVKGTHIYTLEKEKSGYPPLFDFVTFTPAPIKHTCNFYLAPLPILRALFDEKTIQEILALEKEKWKEDHKQHTCTKAELLTLLQHRPTSPTQISDLEEYFLFKRRGDAQQRITGKDTVTGIHSERRM